MTFTGLTLFSLTYDFLDEELHFVELTKDKNEGDIVEGWTLYTFALPTFTVI